MPSYYRVVRRLLKHTRFAARHDFRISIQFQRKQLSPTILFQHSNHSAPIRFRDVELCGPRCFGWVVKFRACP